MVQLFIWTIGLLCVGIVVIHFIWSKVGHRTQTMQPESASVTPSAKPVSAAASTVSKQFEAAGGNAPRQQTAAASTYPIKPSTAARDLVDSLVILDTSNGAFGEAQAAAWKENLKRLIQQGDASVPAINEFLQKNTDVQFSQEIAGALGYSSARMAMIDALMQIGSSHAIGALDSVLQSTEGPQEIAMVTQYLEKTEPGVFLQHAFDAAQRILGNVANGSLANVDVAPLFQVFQQYEYGNAYTVSVLKDSANQWNRYASIALAQLPDEAGVPALVQLATGEVGSSPGARSAALQALTGIASQSAGAREALMGLARQNSLSPRDWEALVPFLAGNQDTFQASALGNPVAGFSPTDIRGTYIGSNHQSFWTAPLGVMTLTQVTQQSAFIDQMLNVATDPAATQALQRAKGMLENRRMVLANSSGQ